MARTSLTDVNGPEETPPHNLFFAVPYQRALLAFGWYGPLVQFAEIPHLLCLSIASSSSSSDRGEMPRTRNPGKLSEAVVSIRISST